MNCYYIMFFNNSINIFTRSVQVLDSTTFSMLCMQHIKYFIFLFVYFLKSRFSKVEYYRVKESRNRISNIKCRRKNSKENRTEGESGNAKQNIIPYLILLESLLAWSRIYAFYPDSGYNHVKTPRRKGKGTLRLKISIKAHRHY